MGEQNGMLVYDWIDDMIYNNSDDPQTTPSSILGQVRENMTTLNGASQPFGFAEEQAFYSYDGNGNMITAGPNGYIYNLLNLPHTMNTASGTSIQHYLFDGEKYKKQTTEGGTQHTYIYLGGIEWLDGKANYLNFADGRLVWKEEEKNPVPQYRIADHLGNTRVFFEDRNEDGSILSEAATDDPEALEVLQRLWYYSFGMEMDGIGQLMVTPGQNYRYNGKELDEATGLYAYGFRMYDPAIARFTGVDPIADQFANLSVYNYASNDPIGNIDLHGLQGVDVNETSLATQAAAMVGTAWEGLNNGGLWLASFIYPNRGQANAIRNAAAKNGNEALSFYSDEQVLENYELRYSIADGYYADPIGGGLEESLEFINDGVSVLGVYGGGGPVLAARTPGLTNTIREITSQFGKFECMQCANSVVDALKNEGVSGQVLDVVTPKTIGMQANIWSDRAGELISTNGRHRAVLVEGKVYDNINPAGVSYRDWVNDLHAPAGYSIKKTSF